MKFNRFVSLLVLVLFVASLLAACAPAATPTAAPKSEKLKVFGAFATPIEEPWDGVIHAALIKAREEGKIDYEYTENIGYSGDMERILREVAEQKKPDIIFGDAFGNEEAVRRVAKDFPQIAFVFGSGLGPSDPNLSVFDNWIHEPAYLCGMLAGGLTKTGTIGVVGGYPVPEVNRDSGARRPVILNPNDLPVRQSHGHDQDRVGQLPNTSLPYPELNAPISFEVNKYFPHFSEIEWRRCV